MKSQMGAPNIWRREKIRFSFGSGSMATDFFVRTAFSDVCLAGPSRPSRPPIIAHKCTLELAVKHDEQTQSTVTAWPARGCIQI